jgi:hypothetical protein
MRVQYYAGSMRMTLAYLTAFYGESGRISIRRCVPSIDI